MHLDQGLRSTIVSGHKCLYTSPDLPCPRRRARAMVRYCSRCQGVALPPAARSLCSGCSPAARPRLPDTSCRPQRPLRRRLITFLPYKPGLASMWCLSQYVKYSRYRTSYHYILPAISNHANEHLLSATHAACQSTTNKPLRAS